MVDIELLKEQNPWWRILKDDADPRYIELAALLLTRTKTCGCAGFKDFFVGKRCRVKA
jgi:hypothetical protein